MARLPVTIRDMHLGDVEGVAEIEAEAFADAWAPSAFRDLLSHGYARLRVACEGSGAIAGYCVLLRAADEGEIANICTALVHRGRGIGAQLLDDALQFADNTDLAAVYLEVRTSNGPARDLYGSRGFELVGRRRHYYQHPTEDALVLRRVRPVGSPA
jgi:ribosomal-protein-alanine N-acetyltransferase